MRSPRGLLLVDKPEGPTSHDIVGVARRALGMRRVGHAGTLDPFATGLLLLLVGQATRLSEYFVGMDKTYDAVLRLGAVTDTDDRTGTVTETSEAWRTLEAEAVHRAAAGFRGSLEQIPPAFSAKKVKGERLYAKARRGEVVAPDPVRVEVYALDVTAVELPEVHFRVRCSSGTYVRALGRDIGRTLGVGGHLTELRRTRIGPFDVADAVPPELLTTESAIPRLVDPLQGLAHLPRVELDADEEKRVHHGGFVSCDIDPGGPDLPTLAIREDRLVAVGFVRGGQFRPRKVFAEANA